MNTQNTYQQQEPNFLSRNEKWDDLHAGKRYITLRTGKGYYEFRTKQFDKDPSKLVVFLLMASEWCYIGMVDSAGRFYTTDRSAIERGSIAQQAAYATFKAIYHNRVAEELVAKGATLRIRN